MGSSGFTVLAVDDKQTNLEILSVILQSAGHQVVTAAGGAEAWEILQTQGHRFQVVLLDRIMPNMSGLEVLEKIKGDPSLKALPVIMQTSADATHEILEGIQAGAYYYLTKPYEKKILLEIVHAAIRDYNNYQSLQKEVQENARTWGFLQSGIFRFRTMVEARELAPLLANGCPEPGRAVLGLVELLANAVEHGNLGITYEEKSMLDEQGQVDAEIERRLALPENSNKYVEVAFSRREGSVEIIVTDQGAGFDWESYLTLDETRAFDSHGRGIAMAKIMSFDRLEYRGSGNQVVCTILNTPQPITSQELVTAPCDK
ncbi:response regulator [Candidatus Nitronereus thalassa]|uniref:Response regulator n=1 Tax=Candidatus Nitronereus thalassa TaxID=3020898 RepID=A0ABU3KAB9_9BACT|nr:response regulator [Candidatus Nitronereus thalassa]MDT7043356.1 response regulator [Candidatus Nitronereus thalassa]